MLVFFFRAVVSVPVALRHYRSEFVRLLSDIAWGNGSLVVGGGTAGVALVLGVDALMDMGRTATNVICNCLASVVVAKWEGELPANAGARPVIATDSQRM